MQSYGTQCIHSILLCSIIFIIFLHFLKLSDLPTVIKGDATCELQTTGSVDVGGFSPSSIDGGLDKAGP